jgi:hypothetical protein
MPTRRTFVKLATLSMLRPRLALGQSAASTHLNLAEIDRARILAAANKALEQPPTPNGDLQSDAFLAFTLNIPALAAASVVDPDNAARYGTHAAAYLEAWFLNPATRPSLTLGNDSYEPLIDLAPYAEIAVALPYLQLEQGFYTRLKASFARYLTFLSEDRTALLARDSKSHHASAWLLQVAAFSRLTANDALLTESRHRFKTTTIRAQINADGAFPHELTTENPYRNSLFNLDLLAGVCVLLSTRFDSLWDHELQDGPGMRAAIAFHARYIKSRSTWPYRADMAHFSQLPGRRPALLFAARAYSQPDYAVLWKTLDPDPTDPAILRAFPIRQPILWQNQTKL